MVREELQTSDDAVRAIWALLDEQRYSPRRTTLVAERVQFLLVDNCREVKESNEEEGLPAGCRRRSSRSPTRCRPSACSEAPRRLLRRTPPRLRKGRPCRLPTSRSACALSSRASPS